MHGIKENKEMRCGSQVNLRINQSVPHNRSNGIVNVGFVMYHSMKTVATETILFVRSRRRKGKKAKAAKGHEDSNGKADKGRENGHSTVEGPEEEDPIAVLWRICSGTLIPGMINVVLAVTPFAAFQGISWSNRTRPGSVLFVQGSAKRCFLGCVNSLPGSAWL